MQVTCIYEGHSLLGESPIWHPQSKMLYWVDAIKPALHAFNPSTNQHQEWPMPALIGSIAVCENGGLVAAIGTGFAFIDLPSGAVRMQKIVNEACAPFHLNDGKCDRLGRFWAGEVSHNTTHPQGKLYCLYPNGQIEIHSDNLTLFNGPCWSPCSRYFYFSDYYNQKPSIFRCHFNLKTGKLGPLNPLIQIPVDDPGIPDGCTIDTEGYLWCAKWNGSRITRYTPQGQIDREIELPIQRPTSCIFGGEHWDTLFITSAAKDLKEITPLSYSNNGALFAIKFKHYRGIPETPFGAFATPPDHATMRR